MKIQWNSKTTYPVLHEYLNYLGHFLVVKSISFSPFGEVVHDKQYVFVSLFGYWERPSYVHINYLKCIPHVALLHGLGIPLGPLAAQAWYFRPLTSPPIYSAEAFKDFILNLIRYQVVSRDAIPNFSQTDWQQATPSACNCNCKTSHRGVPPRSGALQYLTPTSYSSPCWLAWATLPSYPS